jgi:hypothetical protein
MKRRVEQFMRRQLTTHSPPETGGYDKRGCLTMTNADFMPEGCLLLQMQ